MSTADAYVRARIDTNTKERGADALEAMGLSQWGFLNGVFHFGRHPPADVAHSR